MRSRVIYILLSILILSALLFSPLTSYLLKDLIISKLEKILDMNIVIGKIEFKFPSRLAVSDIKAIDKYGPAFIAENADFQLDVIKIVKAKVVLNCNFRGVGFKSGLSNRLNDILKQFAVPVQNIYFFDDMSGIITIGKGVFAVNDLQAKGPDFKFSGNFSRLGKKDVDYEIEFYINTKVVALEENQKNPFLIDEDNDGWYMIRLSLKGDPRRPSNVFFSTEGIKLEVKPHGQ